MSLTRRMRNIPAHMYPIAILAPVLIFFHFAVSSANLHDVFPTPKLAHELREMSFPSQSMAEAFTRIWKHRSDVHAHYVRERNAKHLNTNFSTVAERNAYDYFEPEWNCEDEVRLGADTVSSGDGPKFVCGSEVLASTEDCIVYSVGSNFDFSFEFAVSRIAPQCEIHTFDGTLDFTKRSLPAGLKERNIHFHHWNIVSECLPEENSKLSHPSECVSDSLKKLTHEGKTITWLKIDCEGCEYTVIPKFIESPIEAHQIMVEVHGTDAQKIANLFNSLYNAGMMIFHKERNHWGCKGYLCVEYSLIGSTYAQKVLHTFLAS